ncbi:MAG: hypothetical protein GXO08_00955 [Aquificae bacterium]|nr:hypothetical protein [Aquificota bacterium]
MKKFGWVIPLFLIVVAFGLSLWARYEPLKVWNANKEQFFVGERPIFTAYDAYYYARLADDYRLGVFEPGGTDRLRFVPDYKTYPAVIPFYSWLFAQLSALFKKPVENLALWLVPVLASAVVIPLVLLFWRAGLPLTGFAAALFGSLALIYVVRTSLARLDTDSIVLFSLFALPMAAYLFAESSGRKKYLFLLLVAFFSNLFYWGYLHPDLNFALWVSSLLFLFFPYLKDLLSERRLLKPQRELLIDAALLTVAFNPFILLKGVQGILDRLARYVFEFGTPLTGNFPNVQISISELQKLGLSQVAKMTVGNELALFVGAFGLLAFAVLRLRLFLLLLPVLLMGLLAFKGASRFAMFLAPFLGLGIGFLLDLIWSKVKDRLDDKVRWPVFGALALALVLSAVLLNRKSFEFVPKPIMTPAIASAFIEVGKTSPPEAWVLTWWDYGYAIQYYARRATFHDGGSQLSPKTYFVALAFTTDNATEAVNVSKTLTVCGAKCIKRLLKEGYTAEEIKEMFASGKLLKNATVSRPVYWVFTSDLIGKFYWISYFGTWDFKTLKGRHLFISPSVCRGSGPTKLTCRNPGASFEVDLTKMKVRFPNGLTVPLKYFATRTPQNLEVKKNPYALYGYALELVYTYAPNVYAWYFMPDRSFVTMFNQLYMLRNDEIKSFNRTKERFPDYVFYLLR